MLGGEVALRLGRVVDVVRAAEQHHRGESGEIGVERAYQRVLAVHPARVEPLAGRAVRKTEHRVEWGDAGSPIGLEMSSTGLMVYELARLGQAAVADA